MPEPLRYLAYGSNLHPKRLTRRTPSARLIGTVTLPGWRLHFNKLSRVDGSGKCHIVRAGGGNIVYGAVYELAAEEKPFLDEIEGVGHGYIEQSIDIGEYVSAFTYIAEPHATARPVKPFDWYKQLVLAGARYHGFPTAYLKIIEETPARTDTDNPRSREHRELLKALKQNEATATSQQ